MTTKFNAYLSLREFGSAVFSVAELHGWITRKKWQTEILPPLDGCKFIQIEYLLCEIESRALNQITDKDAKVIVKTADMKTIAGLEDRPDIMEDLKRWQHGADAHLKWREVIRHAIAVGEIVPLDMGSRLPIVAPATEPTADTGKEAAAKVKAVQAGVPMETDATAIHNFLSNEKYRHTLGALQRSAINKAGNFEVSDVWNNLSALAEGKKSPFTGKITAAGLEYKENGVPLPYTKIEFIDWLQKKRTKFNNRTSPHIPA